MDQEWESQEDTVASRYGNVLSENTDRPRVKIKIAYSLCISLSLNHILGIMFSQSVKNNNMQADTLHLLHSYLMNKWTHNKRKCKNDYYYCSFLFSAELWLGLQYKCHANETLS